MNRLRCMLPRLAVAVVFGVAALVLVSAGVIGAGLTDSMGSTSRLMLYTPGWIPDSAQADTFWDSSVIDVPGLSVYQQHCHGGMRLELQVGATGPTDNPCVEAMNPGGWAGSGEIDAYGMLPNGSVLYRESVDHGPWRYCVGPVITGPAALPISNPC